MRAESVKPIAALRQAGNRIPGWEEPADLGRTKDDRESTNHHRLMILPREILSCQQENCANLARKFGLLSCEGCPSCLSQTDRAGEIE